MLVPFARAIFCAVLVVAGAPLDALVDRDGDGVSDVWTAQNPAVGPASADDDADGVSNREEAAAGTDAGNPRSGPGAAVVPGSGGRVDLHWPSVAGKAYRIRTAATVAGAWSTLPEVHPGTGDGMSVTVRDAGAAAEAARFWRLGVEDCDTDGDGFTDWEELALGMDPKVAAVAPVLPAPAPMPALFQAGLEAAAAPLLANRKWARVKIPGLREQVLDAQVNDRNRVWQDIAPGFANVIYDVHVADGVITALLDLGGLVQSRDRGETWRHLSYDLTGSGNYRYFFSFDISPADSRRIVVGGFYLSRSEDGGRTWTEVRDEAVTEEDRVLPPIRIAPTAGVEGGGERTAFGKVRFNADGSRVFAAPGALGHNRLPRKDLELEMAAAIGKKLVYVGDATGRNFRRVELSTTFAGIRSIAADPLDAKTVYLSYGDGTLYVTRDADAVVPTFHELEMAGAAGYQVIDIEVSPHVRGELLLSLVGQADVTNGKLLQAKVGDDGSLACTPVVFKEPAPSTAVIRSASLLMARWDPRKAGRVYVGRGGVAFHIVSEDSLKTFRMVPFPTAELQHGEPAFYAEPHWFRLDPRSDLAVSWSTIGAWVSPDRFKNWSDLWMKYEAGVYGNKGVGFAECAVSLELAGAAAYQATNDHGVFRSVDAKREQWRRVSPANGAVVDPVSGFKGVLYFPVGASADDACLYTVARRGEKMALYDNPECKLLRSRDQGATWTDVTSLVSADGLLPMGLKWRRMLLSADARYQWLVSEQAFWVSVDAGASFQRIQLPVDGGYSCNGIAYDAPRHLLYVSTNKGLTRSRDGGSTWELLYPGYFAGVGATGAGDLVLGRVGTLMVVPQARIDEFANQGGLTDYLLQRAGFVRATVGDTVDEAVSSQDRFAPIVCAGDTVLVAVGAGAFSGNRLCGSGVLLSRDGGRTFRWAQYNLPSALVGCAAIGPGEILVGCSGGAYRWDLKALGANPAPAR